MPTDAPPPPSLLVLSSFPKEETAHEIGAKLVEEKLAACISLLPGAQSIYHWEGAIQRDQECLALMKTTKATYPKLEKRLIALHPYETPEVLAVDVAHGSKAYLEWMRLSLES